MKQLLNEARQEIIQLRQRLQIAEAKTEVVEVFAAALGLNRQNGAMCLDVVWAIERKLEELEGTSPTGKTAPTYDPNTAGSCGEQDTNIASGLGIGNKLGSKAKRTRGSL